MPINALTAGVAALAINSTAFTIEIFRGGFAAVPVAQHDAARALGLRPALIMALVVVPQVFRIVLPPLGNQIVSVVLGSGLDHRRRRIDLSDAIDRFLDLSLF